VGRDPLISFGLEGKTEPTGDDHLLARARFWEVQSDENWSLKSQA